MPNNNIDRNISENLKEAIKNSGKTQKQFAEEEGVSLQLISGYCTGQFPIPMRRLLQFSKDLNISLETLQKADTGSDPSILAHLGIAGLAISILNPISAVAVAGLSLFDYLSDKNKRDAENGSRARYNAFASKIDTIFQLWQRMDADSAKVFLKRAYQKLPERNNSGNALTDTLDSGITLGELDNYITSFSSIIIAKTNFDNLSKPDQESVRTELNEIIGIIIRIANAKPKKSDEVVELARMLGDDNG